MKLLNKKHTEKQKPLHYILPYNDFLMSFVVYIGLYKGKFDVNSCFLASLWVTEPAQACDHTVDQQMLTENLLALQWRLH